MNQEKTTDNIIFFTTDKEHETVLNEIIPLANIENVGKSFPGTKDFKLKKYYTAVVRNKDEIVSTIQALRNLGYSDASEPAPRYITFPDNSPK